MLATQNTSSTNRYMMSAPHIGPSSASQHVMTSVTSRMDSAAAGMDRPAEVCSQCRQLIRERHLLKAVGAFWHEDCLKCSCCDCRLGEVGSTLFAKSNLVLCRRDYLR